MYHFLVYYLQQNQLPNKSKTDACYSLQETAFAMISEAVERALSFTRKKELMIVGGVAANKRLSEMLQDVCKRHSCKFFVVPLKYAGDCGSQICWTGLLESQVKNGEQSSKRYFCYTIMEIRFS